LTSCASEELTGWRFRLRGSYNACIILQNKSPLAIGRLRGSLEIIPQLAEAIRQHRLEDAAAHFRGIAEEEAKAHTELSKIAAVTEFATPE
jgi:hypothetical protein